MADSMVRILTKDGSIRAIAASTRQLVEDICQRQKTDPTATVALGRLVTGAALMGSLLKGRQRLALQVEGNGPLKKMTAETDAFGHVRGSIKVPVSGVPPLEDRFDVASAVGRAGFLHVVKDLGLKDPYRGMVQLQSSEIAEDLAYYFTTSEQTPSSVALGVSLDAEGHVGAAGGFLIQAMPEGDDELISVLERRLADFPSTTTLFRDGYTPIGILERLFADIPFAVKEESDLAFRCNCSREQVRGVLIALGDKELKELIEREEEASVTCEFCKHCYVFSKEELTAIARESGRD